MNWVLIFVVCENCIDYITFENNLHYSYGYDEAVYGMLASPETTN